MNLVSRLQRDGSERACFDCIGQPGKNQNLKVRNVPLSSLNVQESSTKRPVLGASSSTYSEWNIYDKWSSQVWKSVEMFGNTYGETRRRQVCHRWWYGLWRHHRIEPFSKITIVLEQCEWPIAKDIGPFFRRCNARHRQTLYDLEFVYFFDIGSICIHGKELLRQCTSHHKK